MHPLLAVDLIFFVFCLHQGPQAIGDDMDLGGEPIGGTDMDMISSGDDAASVDSTQGTLEVRKSLYIGAS